jgi:hypothetical protein
VGKHVANRGADRQKNLAARLFKVNARVYCKKTKLLVDLTIIRAIVLRVHQNCQQEVLMRVLPLVAVLLVCAVSPVLAKNGGKWPKDAVDMTPEATAAVFSGKTIDFKIAKYYFAPDKTLVGIHLNKGKVDGFSRGTWSVQGNEFCAHSEWPDKNDKTKTYPYDWCNKLKIAGKVVWFQNTKPDDQYYGDIYTDQIKRLHKGDSVSKQADKLAAAWGY